jgi:RNA polymerase sigma-70 factor, ECF subfamily
MASDIYYPVAKAEKPDGELQREAVNEALYREIEALIPRLTRYARALTRDLVNADDLVQEALTRALAKVHLWRSGTDLRAWLFTILHHQHINHVRRAARDGNQAELSEWDRPTLEPAQGTYLELRDLEKAINKLSHEQRTAILLVGAQEMQYEEAASLLNLPLGTVRSRVSRGRAALRRLTDRAERCAAPRPSAPTFQGMAGDRTLSRVETGRRAEVSSWRL